MFEIYNRDVASHENSAESSQERIKEIDRSIEQQERDRAGLLFDFIADRFKFDVHELDHLLNVVPFLNNIKLLKEAAVGETYSGGKLDALGRLAYVLESGAFMAIYVATIKEIEGTATKEMLIGALMSKAVAYGLHSYVHKEKIKQIFAEYKSGGADNVFVNYFANIIDALPEGIFSNIIPEPIPVYE